MEGGSRRQSWINNRRSQNKKPPHGSWQRTVPSWEKDFCKAVGSLDWETLLHMKKYMQFYDNVINWDDSAGKEAFGNAKKRYWAEINWFSCDIPLPDPDLYIQNIDWDSEFNYEVLTDLDSMPVSPKSDHDPVVIFGDSFVANQGFSPMGWGDAEENFEVPVNNYSENYGDPWGQNWNLGDSCNNTAASGWPGCNNNINHYTAWENSDGNGQCYTSWGDGCNNDSGWGWGYNDNSYNYVGPYVEDQGLWDDGNVRTAGGDKCVSSYGTSRVQANDGCKNRGDKGRHKGSYRGKQDKRAGSRGWDSINSCGPVDRRAAVRVGENWNRERRVS